MTKFQLEALLAERTNECCTLRAKVSEQATTIGVLRDKCEAEIAHRMRCQNVISKMMPKYTPAPPSAAVLAVREKMRLARETAMATGRCVTV